EHPMDGRNTDSNARGVIADLAAGGRGDVRDQFGYGERSDLDGVVTGFFRETHRVRQFPVLEDLVANPEVHGGERPEEGTKAQEGSVVSDGNGRWFGSRLWRSTYFHEVPPGHSCITHAKYVHGEAQPGGRPARRLRFQNRDTP